MITGAFTLGELSGGGSIGLGVSSGVLTAKGAGLVVVGMTAISMKINDAGYPVDDRPFVQAALGLLSMSETNGMFLAREEEREDKLEKRMELIILLKN
ncbi:MULTISPECIES: hypothetical protein [unclassified Sphingobacterium]|uniref:hypothetical protein n=1 Tax=unclassified Sphingobacterium TaxID=2609468 RepID=UPI0029539CD2|nr:hypothetical protein [Sphingobacterium sp. UGAL515B_05]WON94253.1 hypothetical protein OK025_23785 [Sphingobacterium sp. UGAL515B_05]